MFQKNLFSSCLAHFLIIIISALSMTACGNQSESVDESITETIPEPVLSDGCYYLNGDMSNCFIKIHNENIQFIAENENQMQTFFDYICKVNENFSNSFEVDEWSRSFENNWQQPKSFILKNTPMGSTHICFDIAYDDNGNMISCSFAEYIDENNIDYFECKFTRLAMIVYN